MREAPLCGETVRDLMKIILQMLQSVSAWTRCRIPPSTARLISAAPSLAPQVQQHRRVGARLRESTHPYGLWAPPGLGVFLLTARSGEETGPSYYPSCAARDGAAGG